MPLHLHFDYTLPFTVGDKVYVPYDASGTDYQGKPIDFKYYTGIIHSIQIVFIGNANYGTNINKSLQDHEVGVSSFLLSMLPSEEYKIILTDPVDYSPYYPNVFLTEEEVKKYIAERTTR